MKSRILNAVATFLIAVGLTVPLTPLAAAQGVQPGYPSTQAGRVLASSYANWRVQSLNAVSAGSASMTLNVCNPPVGSKYRKIKISCSA